MEEKVKNKEREKARGKSVVSTASKDISVNSWFLICIQTSRHRNKYRSVYMGQCTSMCFLVLPPWKT